MAGFLLLLAGPLGRVGRIPTYGHDALARPWGASGELLRSSTGAPYSGPVPTVKAATRHPVDSAAGYRPKRATSGRMAKGAGALGGVDRRSLAKPAARDGFRAHLAENPKS